MHGACITAQVGKRSLASRSCAPFQDHTFRALLDLEEHRITGLVVVVAHAQLEPVAMAFDGGPVQVERRAIEIQAGDRVSVVRQPCCECIEIGKRCDRVAQLRHQRWMQPVFEFEARREGSVNAGHALHIPLFVLGDAEGIKTMRRSEQRRLPLTQQASDTAQVPLTNDRRCLLLVLWFDVHDAFAITEHNAITEREDLGELRLLLE